VEDEDPQISDLVFKTTPISDHVAKFRGDRSRDRGDLALKKRKKERKKETAAKYNGRSRVALSQPAALLNYLSVSTDDARCCSSSAELSTAVVGVANWTLTARPGTTVLLD